MLRITLVTTSARVAPGVLTASAWDLLRSVPVFCGSPGHPQRSALAEAGVPVEVVDVAAGAVRFVGENGHSAGGGVPAVSEEFVAAMRALAAGAGVTEVAWLAEPAHILPVPSGAGPDADGAEPALGVSEPATGPTSGPTTGPAGEPDTAGEVPVATRTHSDGCGDVAQRPAGEVLVPSAPASVGSTEIRVLAGTRELPGSALLDAVAVMDRLRSPGGCPWDAEQTHASLAPYLLEEAYEAYQAIEDGNLAELREELGDVLLQVLFHARVAAEGTGGSAAPGGGEPGGAGELGGGSGGGGSGWDVDAVAADLVTKLVRRHPHVFGEVTVDGAEAVAANWEIIKNAEKGRASVTDGVPSSLPALSLANKLLARSARIGIPFDLAVGSAASSVNGGAWDAVGTGAAADASDVMDVGDADTEDSGVGGSVGEARAAGDTRNVGPDLPGTISALAHRIALEAGPGKASQEEAEEAGKVDSAPGDGSQGDAAWGEDAGPPVPALDSDVQVGRLLFAAVALATTAGVDAEAALRRVTRTFRDRIIELERRISNNV